MFPREAREHREIFVARGNQREANEKIITFNLSIGLIEDVETLVGRNVFSGLVSIRSHGVALGRSYLDLYCEMGGLVVSGMVRG